MLYNASNVNQWKRDGNRPRPLQDSTEMEIRDALAKSRNGEVNLCHNTRAVLRQGVFNDPIVSVYFHATEIVRFNPNGTIRLNSGGYHTVTTKQRLNALLRHRGISVTQKAFAWFVSDETGTLEFEDGMIVR